MGGWQTENDTLARIGTSCFQQLLESNVRKLSPAKWESIVSAFVQLFTTTTAYQLFDPELHAEVEPDNMDEPDGKSARPLGCLPTLRLDCHYVFRRSADNQHHSRNSSRPPHYLEPHLPSLPYPNCHSATKDGYSSKSSLNVFSNFCWSKQHMNYSRMMKFTIPSLLNIY